MDALVRAEVALDHLDVVEELGQVLAAAGGEVVEHAHGVASGEQRADEIRADEAGAARDENLPTAHASRPRGSIVWQGAATRQCYCTADRKPEQRGRRHAGDEPERRPRRRRRRGSRRREPARADRAAPSRAALARPSARRPSRPSRSRTRSPTTPMSAAAWTYAFWTPQRRLVRRERCRGHIREPVAGRRRGEGRSSPGARMPASRRPCSGMGAEDLPADVGEHGSLGVRLDVLHSWSACRSRKPM